jgi:hypothetical protein
MDNETIEDIEAYGEDPEASARPGTGLGFDSGRRRLEAVYGRDARVEVKAAPDRFRVELSLPALPPGG